MNSSKAITRSPLSLSNRRGSESGSERSACSSKERVDSFSRLRKEHSKDSAGTVENHTSTPNPHKGCERLTRKDFSGQRWRVSSRDKAVMAIPCKKERKKSMNELMEDLYVLQDRKSAKRTANKKAAERRIVDQIKLMTEKKVPTSAFIELYQNILQHMRRQKTKLLNRLWELGLPQKLDHHNLRLRFSTHRMITRRHSSGSMDKSTAEIEESIENAAFECPRELILERLSRELHEQKVRTAQDPDCKTAWGQKYALLPVEEVPEKYAKFLRSLCQCYNSLCVSSALLEKLCNKVLRLCQHEPNITGCNIHKSLFMTKVLNNDIIKRATKKAKEAAQDTKIIDRCKEMTQNVCKLYQIEDDIKNSRVKIKINPADRARQGYSDSCSGSDDMPSESEGEEGSYDGSRPLEVSDRGTEAPLSLYKTPVWKKTVDEIMDMIEGSEKALNPQKPTQGETGKKRRSRKKRAGNPAAGADEVARKLQSFEGVEEKATSTQISPPMSTGEKERAKVRFPGWMVQQMKEELAATMKRIDELVVTK